MQCQITEATVHMCSMQPVQYMKMITVWLLVVCMVIHSQNC